MKDWQYVPRRLLGEKYFRWRGGEVSRLEALSDAVFALSMTLLVVSLEVPSTFAEMKLAFMHLPSFAVCFAILLMCWYTNYMFHRRYGMEDFLTVLMTGIQLFLILFYVYPLKFLFTWLIEGMMGREPRTISIASGDIPTLMIYYSGGFAAIFLIFMLMYVHAWRHRETLVLDHNERVITRSGISSHALSVAIALLSVLLVVIEAEWAPLAGIIYFLMGPAQGVNGYLWGRKLRDLPTGAAIAPEPGHPGFEAVDERGMEGDQVDHPDRDLDGTGANEQVDQ